jgi:hypothetical protein
MLWIFFNTIATSSFLIFFICQVSEMEGVFIWQKKYFIRGSAIFLECAHPSIFFCVRHWFLVAAKAPMISVRCYLTLVWDRAMAINAAVCDTGIGERSRARPQHLLSRRASMVRRPIRARRDPGTIADVLASGVD